MKRTIRSVGLLALGMLLAGTARAQEIKVGGSFDLTGLTADVGKPFAAGVRDAVAWVNDNGAIMRSSSPNLPSPNSMRRSQALSSVPFPALAGR